jgi:arginine exporter protein ArgO
MIWKLWQAQKMIREGRENPAKFAGGEARDALLSVLIVPGLTMVAILVMFGIVGFSSLLGGPYLLFKIFFWMGAVIVFILGCIAYAIIRAVIHLTKHVVSHTIKKESISVHNDLHK